MSVPRSKLPKGRRKKLYTFFIDPDLAVALKAIKKRDQIGEGEAIREALRDWLGRKGVLKPAQKKPRIKNR